MVWLESRNLKVKWVHKDGRPVYLGVFQKKNRPIPPRGYAAIELWELFRDKFAQEGVRAWRSKRGTARTMALVTAIEKALAAWRRVNGAKRHDASTVTLVDRARVGALPALCGLLALTGEKSALPALTAVERHCTVPELQIPARLAAKLLTAGGLHGGRRTKAAFDALADWVDEVRTQGDTATQGR